MKAQKVISICVVSLLLAYLGMFAYFSDPQASYSKHNLKDWSGVYLGRLESSHSKPGMFKSLVQLSMPDTEDFIYIGQCIQFTTSSGSFQIKAGITIKKELRIEVWQNDSLAEVTEAELLHPVKTGHPYTLAVEMYDQSNLKYPGKANLRLRLYEGTGFFKDHGSLQLKLTSYHEVRGARYLSVFSDTRNLQRNAVVFSDLRLWKGWNSAD